MPMLRALVVAHQVMMHRARRQQRTDRNAIGPDASIRQHDELITIGNGLPCFSAHAVERSASWSAATARIAHLCASSGLASLRG